MKNKFKMKVQPLALVQKSITLAFVFLALNPLRLNAQPDLLKISPTLPDGLGINIHFTDPNPGEMELLASSGVRWIRMDIDWQFTEKTRGIYDFSAFDHLLSNLDKHKIRAILILDYTHPLYDKGLSPYTDSGRKAFADWAVAAVSHFKGRGVLWEMYNEPNIGFWKPQPNANDYTKLALTVGKAIRKAAPKEAFIGPATSEIALPFLEECFKAGLLEYWAAVTVHPYRGKEPETVVPELYQLRKLIDRYAPKNKKVPIISGEWGYPAIRYQDNNIDEEIQGKYLARQWLINLSNNIILSIWYDWKNDGVEPKNAEHQFGTVRNISPVGQKEVYVQKQAYKTIKTLTNVLRGFDFEKKLKTKSSEDQVLLFKNKLTGESRLAVWSTSNTARNVVIPIYRGRFRVITSIGQEKTMLTATATGLAVTLTDFPQFLIALPRETK